jgi:aminoglycoside 2''-phosphotransferase
MREAVAYLAAIQEAYPGLQVAPVALNEQGQNNVILVARGLDADAGAFDRLVFRFPRYPHVMAQLKTETAVLASISPWLPLPVPLPRFVALEGREMGSAFVGHTMLPGAPLLPEIASNLGTGAALDRLAERLGGFLRALHTIPRSAVPVDLPRAETYASLQEFYARVQAHLFAHMRPAAQADVTEIFERYLQEPGHFAFAAVLRHGDFGASNILYDSLMQRVTGILDFNGVAWGDGAYDVAGLLACYGESFVVHCAKVYPEIQGFIHRARFYRKTFALEEALFGIEHGDEAAFRSGIAGYT